MNLVIHLVAHVILVAFAVMYFLDWRKERKPWQLVFSVYSSGVVVFSCISILGGAA